MFCCDTQVEVSPAAEGSLFVSAGPGLEGLWAPGSRRLPLYIYIYIYIYILNVIILYDIILYYTILYYTILYYTMQILYLSAVARLRCTCCLFHALCRCGLIALTPNIMLRYITLHQIASHPITQIMLHCACCSNEDPAKSGLKSKRILNVEGGLS